MAEYQNPDVVIIGAGAAGISAAVWCRDLGLKVLLLERGSSVGGQMHSIFNPIENYPGRRAQNGEEMLEYFRESLDRYGISPRLNAAVGGIDPLRREIKLLDDTTLPYSALIIATGVRRRMLGIPGEVELRGKGIIESGMREMGNVLGKDVVVVGGGDAAAENALILAPLAATLRLVHRRRQFTARREFMDEIARRENIEIVDDAEVTRILGTDAVAGVEVKDREAGNLSTYDAQVVLIRVGVKPNSELVRNILDLDERGYIRTGPGGETSRHLVFAIGDIANPDSPTLSTAAGSGATASKLVHKLIRYAEDRV